MKKFAMTNKEKWLSFICPQHCCWDQSAYPVSCLPSGRLERAVLKRYYMWHFSMQGLPANNVTIISRRLLPYVFSLTSDPLLAERERQLFSVALSVSVSV